MGDGGRGVSELASTEGATRGIPGGVGWALKAGVCLSLSQIK